MSETQHPAITLPRRCPVCGSWEVRLHRIERLQHDTEPEPDSNRYMCTEGHVFRIDPLLTRSHELISRTHLLIAQSRSLLGELYKLIEEARRKSHFIRH